MTDQTGRQTPARKVRSRSSRKHHWWRWILASIAVLVVLVIVAVGAFIMLQPTPSPLLLPTAAASAHSGTQVTSTTFRINLDTIKVNGKPQPQLAKSLGTQDHPSATLTLTQP